MLKSTYVVFDDMVSSTDTVYSSDKFDAHLGVHSRMSIQCLVEKPNAAGGIQVQVEHSNDGQFWVPKYLGNGPISTPHNVVTDRMVVLAGFDRGSTPSFRFVRLAITLVSPCTRARVKVSVSCRSAPHRD